MKYLKFLFIGPPRSGKSTFRRRLMREIVNLQELGKLANSESTGVGEGNEVTIITPKKITSEHAAIAIAFAKSPECAEAAEGSQVVHKSQWKSMKMLEGGGNNAGVQSDNKDIHSLTHFFFKLISTRNKNLTDTQAKNEITVSEQQLEPEPESEEATVVEPESKEAGVVEQESEEASTSSVVKQESEEATTPSIIEQESFLDSKSPLDEKSKNKAEATPSVSERNENKDQEVEEAFNQLTTILQSDSPEELEELLKSLELIMINMMDIGGQPALLEMLPPLTIGPALYLLFFRLDQKLNEPYAVKFRAQGSKEDIPIPGHYCTKAVMHQSLSSIACFGCYSQEEEMSSKILLCGTYKDEATKKGIDVSSMEKELREELEETKFSTEGLLLDASHTNLFFSVDNMHGDEDEMSRIRTSFESIIKNHFVPIKIPAVWLMLRVVLHLMNKPIVTLSQCKLIYERLSKQMKESSAIVEESSVKSALRFFHRNVGNLMYYDKIPSMQDTVICDPQVVMDSVSSLIFDNFTGPKLVCDRSGFMKKGQFTFDQIAKGTNENRGKHLDVHQLIDLLKDRNILAEIEQKKESKQADEQGSKQAHEIASEQADEQRRKQVDERGREEVHEIASEQAEQASRKFIMPAVLPIAPDVEVDWLKNASQTGEELKKSEREYHKVPIMIHFSCGFVPFGVFSACMAYLIEPRNKKSLQWELNNDAVCRNMVIFRVNKKKENTKFFVTLISRPLFFEIQVSAYKITRNKLNFQYICPSVQQDIINALKTLTSNWKYVPYNMSEKPLFSGPLFHLAFRCTLAQSHSKHLMKFEDSEHTDKELTCTCLEGDGVAMLCQEHLVWFDKVS